MEDEVKKILDEIRPMLAFHRGDVEFVAFDEEKGIVEVRLLGSCKGCSLADFTLKAGIEALVKERLPDVKEVIAVA